MTNESNYCFQCIRTYSFKLDDLKFLHIMSTLDSSAIYASLTCASHLSRVNGMYVFHCPKVSILPLLQLLFSPLILLFQVFIWLSCVRVSYPRLLQNDGVRQWPFYLATLITTHMLYQCIAAPQICCSVPTNKALSISLVFEVLMDLFVCGNLSHSNY